MSAVLQLFHRRNSRQALAEKPVATSEGIRLPDRFDFRDLREFLEAVAPLNPERNGDQER